MEENQEQFQPQPDPVLKEITLTQPARSFLLETSKWAQFFAILGFIFTGFIVIAALFMGSIMESLNHFSQMIPNDVTQDQPNGMIGSGISIFITLIYLLMALLYFFPSLYLYRFSSKTKHGIRSNADIEVEEGLKNLKSVFKFWGILTIIVLGIYLLSFVGMILIGAAMN